MRLKVWHSLVIISLLVLGVYYPAIHAEYNSVDDQKMIASIENAGPLNLEKHFFPETKRYYYRPLTTMTYFIDRDAWGTLPSFMHLENILLHLGCALLVFSITRRLTRLYDLPVEGTALFAAFLFALHPLATESVCWISGRTDPLAGFFMLLAVWLLIIGLQDRRALATILSGPALMLACLAKEVAVFILPGLLWMVAVYPAASVSLPVRLGRRWLTLATPVAAIGGYFVMRHFAIARDTGIKTALKGVVAGDFDLLNKIRVAFKVYGFYFKKLFIPWPLNYGIVEVSGWYVLAGIALAGILVWLAVRANFLGSFALMSFCVLSPAVLIPFGKMAWTPLAERYLYTPVALFAPMAAILIFRWLASLESLPRRRCHYALTALLVVFFATTLHRAWIWQDNLRLYTDTVAKSPNFTAAKAELASALFRKGRGDEAEAILISMQSDSGSSDYLVDDLNLAKRLAGRGEVEDARKILIDHLDKKSKKYYDLMQSLLRINDLRIGKAKDPSIKLAIQKESLSWLIEQQRLRPKAFTLYRIGKMQLAMGQKGEALKSFYEALDTAPADAHYRAAAETFINKLEGS